MISRRHLALLAAPALLPTVARAQDAWPSRPVTLVVPWAAGGSTDAVARILAQKLSTDTGRSFVVDNRTGANGTIGFNSVARARPDGYTMLVSTVSTYAMAPHLMPLPYDNEKDFIGIGLIASMPIIMVVNPSFPARTLAEFIAYAKQRPGDLTYASAGVGSMHHLGAELLKLRAGIDMLHVPYRGTGETIRDLIAGRVQFYMNSPPPLTPLVADGKLRALCVSSNERHPGMPNIPSAKEEGLADLDLNVWFSLFAPRGTPEPVARLLAQKLNEVLADPTIRKRAFDAGALVAPSTPEALAARMERETAAWAEVVRAAKITAG